MDGRVALDVDVVAALTEGNKKAGMYLSCACIKPSKKTWKARPEILSSLELIFRRFIEAAESTLPYRTFPKHGTGFATAGCVGGRTKLEAITNTQAKTPRLRNRTTSCHNKGC